MSEQDARDFLTALGAEIAYWRRRRSLSRAQLGEMVDISETTIGRIERGAPDSAAATSDVWRIAAALGLTFSDMVARAEDGVALAGLPSKMDVLSAVDDYVAASEKVEPQANGESFQVQHEAARPKNPKGKR